MDHQDPDKTTASRETPSWVNGEDPFYGPISPVVTTTLLWVTKGAATKTYNLGDNDKLVEAKAGVATAMAITQQGPMFHILSMIGPKCVFVHGLVHRPDGTVLPPNCKQNIATEDLIAANPKNYADCVPRNLKNFRHAAGQHGVLMLDRDVYAGAYPTPLGDSSPQEYIDLLRKHFDLSGAAIMAFSSASSGNFVCEATGKVMREKHGVHAYLAIEDASDIKRATEVMHRRLILAGLGAVVIDKAGRLHVKTPVDSMTGSPERLDFLRPAGVGPGLRVEGRAEAVRIGGGCFDSRAKVKDLTKEEEKACDAKIARLKGKVPAEDIERARAAYKVRRVEEMVLKGIGREKAEKAVDDVLRGDVGALPAEWLLEMGGGSTVTVADILANPAAYASAAFYDPIEGRDYGHTTARVFVNPNGSIILHSQAHAGQQWFLRSPGGDTDWNEEVKKHGEAGAPKAFVSPLARKFAATNFMSIKKGKEL